jgi:hypothetical protein
MAPGRALGTGNGAERSRRDAESGRGGSDDKGEKKEGDQKNGNNHPMGMAVIVFVPWLLFSMTSVLFAMAYHHYWWAVWGMVLLFVFVSISFLVLHSQQRMGGSWFYFLAMCCLLAIFAGCLSGLYNYWTHMYLYWSYDEAATYSNVLPSEPAEARSDAGKIIFATTARVDTTRAVGFKEGSEYCVAPILDNTQSEHPRVQYWAAGMDCCTARGDFGCDDAWNPKSHSGLVILNTGAGQQSVSTRGRKATAGGTAMMLGTPLADYYFRAVRLAQASFDLTSVEHPIFVRWVVDPDRLQNDYWRLGIGWLVAVICVYLLFAIIAGAILQMWSKRSAASQGARIGD